MAIRGIQLGGLIELAALIVVAVVFALLTLLPWLVAIGIFLVLAAAVVWVLHHRNECSRRKLLKLEQRAQLERELIRAEGERREALRVVGGIERKVPR